VYFDCVPVSIGVFFFFFFSSLFIRTNETSARNSPRFDLPVVAS